MIHWIIAKSVRNCIMFFWKLSSTYNFHSEFIIFEQLMHKWLTAFDKTKFKYTLLGIFLIWLQNNNGDRKLFRNRRRFFYYFIWKLVIIERIVNDASSSPYYCGIRFSLILFGIFICHNYISQLFIIIII